LVGIKNIVIKMLGSRNKINNVQATMEALKSLKDIKPQIHGTRTPQPEAK
jgi:ribosomal protein S5